MGVGEWSGSLLRWERELTEVKDRLRPVFGRSEIRQSAGEFIDGVLSGIARKTGWQLAEHSYQQGKGYRRDGCSRTCWVMAS